jgi:hypothetical protein
MPLKLSSKQMFTTMADAFPKVAMEFPPESSMGVAQAVNLS